MQEVKRQLDYFMIDGAVGGNQEWFRNVVMYIGGCAAATACDSCIYLALRRGKTYLYPGNVYSLTKEDYIAFSQKMKPYIRPRVGGIKELSMFTEGYGKYLEDSGEKEIALTTFSGENTVDEAAVFIKERIDAGYPVPYLMLKHKKRKYKDFVWHWFLCYGYEERLDGVYITVVTYGEKYEFPLRELWDTGYEEKGGLIGIHS